MDTNTTPDHDSIEMRPEWATRYKQLPKSKIYETFHCKDCNAEVMWAISKKSGKTYLAVETTWMSDADRSQNGRTNQRKFYPFHKCTPDAEYQARYTKAMAVLEADRQSKIGSGEIVVGQVVEVYKGKKIPVGTTGVIFWVAPSPDHYDIIKVGLTTPEGEKVFVNIAHIKASK